MCILYTGIYLIHFVCMCILCVYYSVENVFIQDVIHFPTVLPLPVSWLSQDVQCAHVSNTGNFLNGVVREVKSRFDKANLAEAHILDYGPLIKLWKRLVPVLLHSKGNHFKIPAYISESLNQSFREQGVHGAFSSTICRFILFSKPAFFGTDSLYVIGTGIYAHCTQNIAKMPKFKSLVTSSWTVNDGKFGNWRL